MWKLGLVVIKESPAVARDSGDCGSAQQQDENDERDWYPDEPEKNGHSFSSFRVAV
jgi:hypothetical protein